MNTDPQPIYEFGDFRIDAEEKILWRGDSVADVTPKAVEILLVLVENAGKIISKEAIFGRVWPNSFVEEANLTHHIFRLRKLLGETNEHKFIETVPKRGYRFVAEVLRSNSQAGSVFGGDGPNRHLAAAPWRTLGFRAAVLLGAILIAVVIWQALSPKESSEPKQVSTVPEQPLSISRVTNVGKVGGATISPDGRFVAYMQNYLNGEGTLYVRQVDTNTEVKLLPPAERLFGTVSFSPDGSFIYYVSFDDRDTAGALYRISVLGGQAIRLIDDIGYMFAISPDGERVAFVRHEPDQKQASLIIAKLSDKSEQKLITRSNDELNFAVCPAWSPDGSLIAIAAADPAKGREVPSFDLYTVDVRTGALKMLSAIGLSGIGKTVWRSDWRSIVFIGDRSHTRGQIYQLAYPDGTLSRITQGLSPYGYYGLGITADGKTLVADVFENTSQLWAVNGNGDVKGAEQLTLGVSDGSRGLATLRDGGIVYAARTGDDFDLWLMHESNGRREGRPLTNDQPYESDICAVPDRDLIVFASDRDGGQHLYRMNTDGSGLKQLTSGGSFDRVPTCAPDSSSVVYASRRGDHTTLWRVSVDGGEPVQITDFDSDAPSFSPNGKSIACVLPANSIVDMATLAVIAPDGGPPLKSFPVAPFSWNYRPPRWTPDGRSLLFSRTVDMVGNLWEQKLSGGEPRQFTDFRSEVVFNYAFSSDGAKLIIARGKFSGDVVMLKNFM